MLTEAIIHSHKVIKHLGITVAAFCTVL